MSQGNWILKPAFHSQSMKPPTRASLRPAAAALRSGLAGAPERNAAAAGLNDALVGGFIDWEWKAGLRIQLPWDISLGGKYAESLDLDSQAWSKSLEVDVRGDFGKKWDAMLGLVHA